MLEFCVQTADNRSMSMNLPNYDAWLERPYQQAAAEQAAAEDFAERHDMPMESQADWDAIYAAMEDELEAQMEAEAERRYEAQMDAAYERDMDGGW